MDLKTLSQHLGLSPTTVSRALNGYPEVSEKTRRRVLEAARSLNYRPNSAARRLATGKAAAIGFVMETGERVQTDPHFMEFLAGIGERASRAGLDIHIAPCPEGDMDATYRRLAATRQLDGVILSSPKYRDPRIALLHEIKLPFILHGRSEGIDTPYSWMDIDNAGAFHSAASLLVQMGHRRIGLINGPAGMTFADHREAGMRRALEEAGLAFDPALSSRHDMNEEYGYRATMRCLDGGDPPTALLCASIVVALGAIRALGDRNIAVGPGMSVIAHDDVFPYLRPEHFRVPLTCTRSSIRQAGVRVAERLSGIISGAEIEPQGEVWPVELVMRRSVAPPGGRH